MIFGISSRLYETIGKSFESFTKLNECSIVLTSPITTGLQISYTLSFQSALPQISGPIPAGSKPGNESPPRKKRSLSFTSSSLNPKIYPALS